MPLGLCNSTATFQRAMDKILQKFTNVFVMPYLDEIIFYSDNTENHMEHVKQVLDTFKRAELTLNKKHAIYSKVKY